MLALYQPVAADLRFVVAVLKINNDLERMGDLAKNIAKRVLFLTQCERIDLPGDFRSMAAKTQSMVKQSLDALVNSDTALARTDPRRGRRSRSPAPRHPTDRSSSRSCKHPDADRVPDAADQRFAASGAAGRHGHQHRRRRDLHGRRRNRPPQSPRRITAPPGAPASGDLFACREPAA